METINLGENIVMAKVQGLDLFAKKHNGKIDINVMLDYDTLDASVNLETLLTELQQGFNNSTLKFTRLTESKIVLKGVDLN